MGMDVSGLNPKNETGQYFRANVWSWRPLHFLIAIANEEAKVIDDETMKAMSYNDGAGPKNQKACTKLAAALEKVLANTAVMRKNGLVVSTDENGKKTIGFKVERKFAVTNDGHFVGKDKKIPLDDLHSPYYIGIEYALEFVDFLKSCGGFAVC